MSVATNTLRGMGNPADAERYFKAICDAGVASAVHYGASTRGSGPLRHLLTCALYRVRSDARQM